MILWTIQEENAYEQLINNGVYRADASLINTIQHTKCIMTGLWKK